MIPRDLLLRVLFLVILVLPGSGGAALAAQAKRFQDTTEVVLVEVPVQVLSRGEPVRGLTIDDFEVLDGRKRQDLIGFDEVDLSLVSSGGEARSIPELPVSARRHFLLLFDLSFSAPKSIVRAREAADDLVLQGLHPADLVAVATYSASRGARLILGFTSDRRQIHVALDTLGLAEPIDRVADPLGLAMSFFDSTTPRDLSSSGAQQAHQKDQRFLEYLKDLSFLSTQATRDQKKNQILALSGSLGELAGWMKYAQGRKYVVYLSEGFDTSILLGTEGTTEAERTRIQEINRAASEGRYWEVNSEERFGNTSAQSTLSAMIEQFRRADCTIQAVDIGGLRADADVQGASGQSGGRSRGEDGLFIMANETGGELVRNFNDLGAAMSRLLERTSVTYVLAFQPKNLKLDGKYHRLKVKLKKDVKGVELLHRPGYFAPLPPDQRSPRENQLRSAGLIMGGAAGGALDASVLATPFEVAGERSYVPVLVEIDGPSLMAGQSSGVLPTEIYAYAIREDGQVADLFAQAFGLDLSKVEDSLERSGFKYWGHFDLDPGDYLVRVLIRNGRTGRMGLAVTQLHVPVFDQKEAALLPPLFLEQRGKWLLGREGDRDRREVPFPFVLDGDFYLPAARPVVPIGGESRLCLVGFNLDTTSVEVRGQLLDRDGQPVEGSELSVEHSPDGSGAGSGGEQWVMTLRPGSVPAGEYTFVVTVSGPGGAHATSSSIPIRVVD